MPVKIERIGSGKNKGKFRVKDNGTSAKATTKGKAESQSRLLRAVSRGFKPGRGA
jgi:hypothetical protein